MGNIGKMIFFFSVLVLCNGHPLDLESKKGTPIDVDTYLEKYGYLPQLQNRFPGVTAHSEHSRKHALRLFQTFANLPQTGEVNSETVGAMLRPRCGFPDITDQKYDPDTPLKYTAGPKWKNKTVTWRVLSYTDKLTVKEQREAIQNSLRRWENASGLTFLETNETANVKILFASGDHGDGIGNAFDGPGGILAHAFLPEDGRTHFDDDEFWVFHQSDGAEIEMIATHELGHSLGLSHSVTRGALMSPFYQQYSDNFPLHIDDIAGIQDLYGPPDESVTEQESVATTARTELVLSNASLELPVTTRPEVSNKTTASLPANAATVSDPGIFINTTHPNPSVAPVTGTTMKTKDELLCGTKIDAAISTERGTMMLFIGKYIYKIYEDCNRTSECVFDGYPKPIRKVFKKGPKRVKTAAFLPDERKRTYLFKGRKMWRYTGRRLDKGYPKQMDKAVLPYKPNAAFIHKNQFADYQWYMFGGKYFWELHLYSEAITNGVMKTKSYWDYLPPKPDAILQTKDGMIYVFKGKHYNRYDHRRVLLDRKKSIARDLLGAECL